MEYMYLWFMDIIVNITVYAVKPWWSLGPYDTTVYPWWILLYINKIN